jgi:hypothetical protein
MARETQIEAEFTYERSKIRHTNTEVIIVRDKNDDNKRVCMIHVESGTICFKFRGMLTDFECGLNFYTLEEIQLILDMAKKLQANYEKYSNKLDTFLEKE